MPVNPQNLIRTQAQPNDIRNVCILAHVDHGKTSLSDSLLASNGIISHKQQGQLRYLDSRPDEQLRGITMESSAISLYFKAAKRPEPGVPPQISEYLVNLIDSPGHIDFSSEVSVASRLCDGCVIVVDAVEGVCSQTVTVLKQSWDEELEPVLMINKLDKLITILEMTPSEAYVHIVKLVEQVNAVIGSFFAGKRAEEEYQAQLNGTKITTEDMLDEELYFDPVKGNVVFGSAIDGWGFTVGLFAGIYERKLGVNREKLIQSLWGDYYFDPKSKKVLKGAAGRQRNLKPMFAQFILDNIWAVYRAARNKEMEKLQKIVDSLQLKLQGPPDLKSIFNEWIPVSRATLMAIVNNVPSPIEAQKSRMKTVIESTPDHESVDADLVTSMETCDSKGKTCGYVSKVVQVPESTIPTHFVSGSQGDFKARSERIRQEAQRAQKSAEDAAERGGEEEEEEEVVIGVCRIFSGTIEVGSKLNVLGPKYDPREPLDTQDEQVQEFTVTGIYLLMGRDFIPLQRAYSGTIVGIKGMDEKVIKSATIVSPETRGPNFAATSQNAQPILKVALEPEDPTQLEELERGLELLNISDPCVRYELSDEGEHILSTAGELHLERCLKDLRERFAKIGIQASEPVVPFRETIVKSAWSPDPESKYQDQGHVETAVANVDLELIVKPLPKEIIDGLLSNGSDLQSLEKSLDGLDDGELKFENLMALSPQNLNLLFDGTNSDVIKCRVSRAGDRGIYDASILSGFQAAMQKGPLIEEPVQGVAVIVKRVESTSEKGPTTAALRRIITATRELIFSGMEQWSPRILLAQFLCEIQAPTEVLGKLYGVVTRRHGRIISEDIKEGTPFFSVRATIPVVDSFKFSEEIRTRTSGAANPQLVFNGFEILDQDPYWVPTTQEELDALGEFSDRENIALNLVQSIRRRKGLRINQKLIDGSEKMKTFRK